MSPQTGIEYRQSKGEQILCQWFPEYELRESNRTEINNNQCIEIGIRRCVAAFIRLLWYSIFTLCFQCVCLPSRRPSKLACSWTNFYQFELWYGICEAVVQSHGAIVSSNDEAQLSLLFLTFAFALPVQLPKYGHAYFHQMLAYKFRRRRKKSIENMHGVRGEYGEIKKETPSIEHAKCRRKAPIKTYKYRVYTDKRHTTAIFKKKRSSEFSFL